MNATLKQQEKKCTSSFFAKVTQRKMANFISIHNKEGKKVERYEEVAKIIASRVLLFVEQQLELYKPFNDNKIKHVMFSMPHNKSPRLDGYSSGLLYRITSDDRLQTETLPYENLRVPIIDGKVSKVDCEDLVTEILIRIKNEALNTKPIWATDERKIFYGSNGFMRSTLKKIGETLFLTMRHVSCPSMMCMNFTPHYT
ncbi:hypothetical protein Cgig2_023762 [Carnegiea gigantea]|uniref:Uncharacterized protein n=1 Tax=Carnegiea gigantea TaxID=171969 RepID=A0A9Q1KEU4_9CARY|nr:hypothetical protein Cgig2_023762 [Carnegiea gigantea]